MIDDRLIRTEWLHSLVDELPPGSARPEVRRLRALALARPVGYRPAGSNLERRFEWIIERAGDPSFERQVDVGDDRGWIGRVDFIDRRLRVIVEVQSARFHGGLVERERDAVRLDRLRQAGWIVVEVTDEEVWHRAPVVVARVRAARARSRPRRVAHRSSATTAGDHDGVDAAPGGGHALGVAHRTSESDLW